MVRRLLRIAKYGATTLTAALVLIPVLAFLGLAAAGAWYEPAAIRPSVAALPTPHQHQDPPIAPDTTPAAAALESIMGAASSLPGYTPVGPTTAATAADPIQAGCASGPAWVPQLTRTRTLASSSGTMIVSAAAYGAGLAPRALAAKHAAVSGCSASYIAGTLSQLPGFLAGSSLPSGTQILEVVFAEGDILVTLIDIPTNGGFPYGQLSGLAVALIPALDASLTSCANPHAAASDGARNPSQLDYQPRTETVDATPEPGLATPPDASLLDGPLPDVIPPAAGSITTEPNPPSQPAPPGLSVPVAVPVADKVGPGCGWAFTGAVAPTPPTNLASLRAAAIQAGSSALTEKWNAWPNTVKTYLASLATYQADLTSYRTWRAANPPPTTTTTTTTTTTSPPNTTTTVPHHPTTTTTTPKG